MSNITPTDAATFAGPDSDIFNAILVYSSRTRDRTNIAVIKIAAVTVNLISDIQPTASFPNNFTTASMIARTPANDTKATTTVFKLTAEANSITADNAKAIVVGYLTGMNASYQKTFITRMLGDLDIPVLFGFPSGHEYPFINLPIGATVEVSPNGLKIVSEVYTD